MKAVLDTNIFISALISRGVCFRVLRNGFRGEYDLLISTPILQELRETLVKKQKEININREDIGKVIATIRAYGNIVTVNQNINKIERDPQDNIFLELAKAGEADFIVSGDYHLTDLGSYSGIPIVGPKEFLNRLNEK